MPPSAGDAHLANGIADSSTAGVTGNPYDVLIQGTNADPLQIQGVYESHRTSRNQRQREKLLDPAFEGAISDPILQKISDPRIEPGYVDPRHCLVFWARPPMHIRDLIEQVQQLLLTVAPKLWLVPSDCLHMTTLEITHSRSASEIAELIDIMRSGANEITDYTSSHRARLVKPMLSYDAAAIALSFVPAAGEGAEKVAHDEYTYHHLRRDVYELSHKTGVVVDSRYVLPSAHLTVGRFITAEDFTTAAAEGTESRPDPKKMRRWIEKIEEVNQWLQDKYWPDSQHGQHNTEGEWIVGEEKGLDWRYGTLWYGGGTTLRLGKGFER